MSNSESAANATLSPSDPQKHTVTVTVLRWFTAISSRRSRVPRARPLQVTVAVRPPGHPSQGRKKGGSWIATLAIECAVIRSPLLRSLHLSRSHPAELSDSAWFSKYHIVHEVHTHTVYNSKTFSHKSSSKLASFRLLPKTWLLQCCII